MAQLAVDVENVGGIEAATFTFEDPVSVITGPNATNKTSLLTAIAFAVGRDEISIRSDATEASVTLTIGDESVTRTARRSGRGISISGDPWVADADDRALFEYFGCLLEFNPLRSAVRQNEDVEAALKEPVDIDALERERSAKMDEKRRLQRELDRMDDIEAAIAEEERTIEDARADEARLEDELATLREEHSDATDANGDLDAVREERADIVHSLERYETQIENLEDAIDRLEAERDDVTETLAERRATAEEYDVDDLQAERRSIQEEMDEVDRRVDLLQSALTANRELLNSDYPGILGQETDLMEESVTCWVCGQSATVSTIEETTDELQARIEEEEQRKREFVPQLEEIDEQIDEAKEARRDVDSLERRLDDIDDDIESRRESLETKREAAEDVRAEREELDERIDELESEQASEITDLTDELEEVRVELRTTRETIETATERIDSLNEQRRERERTEEQVEALTDEITTLTDRIENLENHLREEFNQTMDEIVERLAFERIERVWLDGSLDLIVAREVDGTVREDSLGSLSESEREVIGLVLALAGYETYDLADIAPVLLMDTLGALDADRARELLEYFGERSEFLITAMLPENAETLGHSTVRPVEQTDLLGISD